MQYLFKSLFLVYIIAKLAMSQSINYTEVCAILVVIASNILREKYIDNIYIIIFEFLIITYGISLNPYFAAFYGIMAYDLVKKKWYIGIVLLIISSLSIKEKGYIPESLLIIGICSLLSYLNNTLKEKSDLLRLSYDKERKYRHELEMVKLKLMSSAEDTAHLAEIKERNRIAREIHDNVGHSIAGALMTLQASYKIFERDSEKSKELIKKSIDNLSNTLTTMKNTVYNIKPKDKVGIEYINEIIDSYSFCEVNFKHSGNFNDLEAYYIEIVGVNIKEALTNASKYSNATQIDISLEINENYLRLYIRDNGRGCKVINENLGLSGMRERIRNVGGNISINGDGGFLIVAVIPLKREVGDVFEGNNSR